MIWLAVTACNKFTCLSIIHEYDQKARCDHNALTAHTPTDHSTYIRAAKSKPSFRPFAMTQWSALPGVVETQRLYLWLTSCLCHAATTTVLGSEETWKHIFQHKLTRGVWGPFVHDSDSASLTKWFILLLTVVEITSRLSYTTQKAICWPLWGTRWKLSVAAVVARYSVAALIW